MSSIPGAWLSREHEIGAFDWLRRQFLAVALGSQSEVACIFSHFQLSTTWLNSTVGVEQKYWHERQHYTSGNDVFQISIIL